MEKIIEGYPLYTIDENGNVFSLRKNRYLKPIYHKNGYAFIDLFLDGKTHKIVSIHRLVAKAFIPNPYNLPQVNHKDENRSNNHVSNLEWCTAKYNQNYGTCKQRRMAHTNYADPKRKLIMSINGKKNSIPVDQFTKDGKWVARHNSTMDVQRNLGYHNSHISGCARGKVKSAYGYVWRYVKEE